MDEDSKNLTDETRHTIELFVECTNVFFSALINKIEKQGTLLGLLQYIYLDGYPNKSSLSTHTSMGS
jgi:hypothetical protein